MTSMQKSLCISILITSVFWLINPTRADLQPISCAEYLEAGGMNCSIELSDESFDLEVDYMLTQNSRGLICGEQSTANNLLHFVITSQNVSIVNAKGYGIILTNFISEWRTNEIAFYTAKEVEYPEMPVGTYVLNRASLELRIGTDTHYYRKLACRLTSPLEVLSYYRDKIAGAQKKNKI